MSTDPKYAHSAAYLHGAVVPIGEACIPLLARSLTIAGRQHMTGPDGSTGRDRTAGPSHLARLSRVYSNETWSFEQR